MCQQEKTVYLVDGSSFIHRAYHAIRGLANSKGFPTNAVLGFSRMILKLLQDKRPAHLAVALDAKGPTFRHTLYPQYKANRPPMPEDLAAQIPVMKRILGSLNLKLVEMEGFEADDLMGTLARICEERGFRVVMVTGDKDFRQLVTANASLWDPMKDVVTDPGSLREATGLEPRQFVDVMGLAGDSSDNVPGVRGVGEKTAVELVRRFGSLEKVLEHTPEIRKPKLRASLESSRAEAELSKRLVTIDCHVPLGVEVEELRMGQPNRGELAKIFRELEFKGLWEQFAPREAEPTQYRLCRSEKELGELVERIRKAGLVSIDTETTSEDPFRAELVGISFAWEAHQAVYLPLAHAYPGVPSQLPWPAVREALRDLLADEGIRKVGQNIKYDAEVLKRHGVELRGLHFDTMVASYVINPSLRQHNLASLAQHYLNHRMIRFAEVVAKAQGAPDFAGVSLEDAMAYSCEDADITLRLTGVLERRLKEDRNQELFHGLEMRLIPVLMDMELRGIRIDVPFLQEMSARVTSQLEKIEQEIYAEAGLEFNLNSPQQLGEVLFEKLQLPVQKKTAKTKRYSTDVRVLRKLAAYPHRVPGLVLRYRTLAKLKSTYLETLVQMVEPSTGRLHTSFNQTVTATGRLSSSSPNLQNIPVRGEEGREIRRGFVAEEGYQLLSADYSQIELRIFAHYSGDEAFREAFQQDEDIHARTAAEIMGVDPGAVSPGMRRVAKAINFGIIYGMGPQKLAEELEIDHKTARNYISAYYERYRGVARYREEMIAAARSQGYVATLFNRRRYLPDIQHANRVVRAEAERMAVNTPIQGTAADLIKLAMVRIHQRLAAEGLATRMLLQVHDELVFEVPDAELEAAGALVREEMEGVHTLSVPLKVDISSGPSWMEAHA